MTSRPIAPAPAASSLHETVRQLLLSARPQVRQSVNTAMVQTYWQIGRLIVEDEQGGEKRAAYGQRVLADLSKRLTDEFGGGFSMQSLWNYRQFYVTFSIPSALRRELTWTHYKSLIRIDNEQAPDWYGREAAAQGWSVRALDRQISTLLYERLLNPWRWARALCVMRTRHPKRQWVWAADNFWHSSKRDADKNSLTR